MNRSPRTETNPTTKHASAWVPVVLVSCVMLAGCSSPAKRDADGGAEASLSSRPGERATPEPVDREHVFLHELHWILEHGRGRGPEPAPSSPPAASRKIESEAGGDAEPEPAGPESFMNPEREP